MTKFMSDHYVVVTVTSVFPLTDPAISDTIGEILSKQLRPVG